ncbi:unnamed protein product, partial [Prorocentrum cordatum]
VCAELDRLNLAYHEKVEPTRLYESVGVVFDGQARKLRHADKRAWKLYLGLQRLIGVGGATGYALRIRYGHLVNFFVLMRPALAVLDLGHHFIAEHRERFAKFQPDLLDEIRDAKGLIFLVEVGLGAPWAPVTYCSDASTYGYALHEACLSDDELLGTFSARGRWRFLDVEPTFLPGAADGPPAAIAAEATATLAAGLAGDPAFDFDDEYRGAACLDRRPARTATLELDGMVTPVADAVVDRHRWALIVRGSWRYAAPIHAKEARTQLLGLIRASRSTRMHGHRVGSMGDNMAALLSFEKGRARDFALRQLCRVAAARQISADIQRRQRHVDADRNPTDSDSRAADRGEVQPGQPQRGPPAALAAIEASLGDLGLLVTAPVDLKNGSHVDILDYRVFNVLASWTRSRKLWWVHFGAPCIAWSQAAGAARSQHRRQGLQLARRTLELMRLCRGFNVHWSLENPASSKLFTWAPLASFICSAESVKILIHYCQYGCTYKKPTFVISDHPDLSVIGRACSGGHAHEILEGKVSVAIEGSIRSRWKTSLAGSYPPALCRAWAKALGAVAPSSAWRRHGDPQVSDDWEAHLAAAVGRPTGDLVRREPVAGPRRRRNYVEPAALAARRRARAEQQPRPYLQTRRVRPITASRYLDSYTKFKVWAQQQGRPLTTHDLVDRTLEDYLDARYFGGKALAEGRYAVHGAIHCLRYPRRTPATLPLSRDALAGWSQAGPGRVRDPLPWGAAVLIADRMIQQGPLGEAAAGALATSFDGYLRPSSALRINGADVHVAAGGVARGHPRVTATIAPLHADDGAELRPRLKNNEHDMTLIFGDQASFKAGRSFVADLLVKLKGQRQPHRPLFPLTLAQYERYFNAAVAALQLHRLDVTPHCARHGGPSVDAARGLRSIPDIQQRGMWRAASSIRRYEKAGTLMRQLEK